MDTKAPLVVGCENQLRAHTLCIPPMDPGRAGTALGASLDQAVPNATEGGSQGQWHTKDPMMELSLGNLQGE